MDEAHKLRNAYRDSNKIGQALRWATADSRKLLLTATPLQNSIMELYGLASLIDERIFGDINAFRSQFTGAGSDLTGLRQRLASFCKRTLRKDVTEYISYTHRKPHTQKFRSTDDEHKLYEAVTAYLLREDSYAIPKRQRHLTELVLRKLLASRLLPHSFPTTPASRATGRAGPCHRRGRRLCARSRWPALQSNAAPSHSLAGVRPSGN
jgi:hypothetical protein